jgi:hypothetical protein
LRLLWLEPRAIQEMLADARQGMDTPHLVGEMVSQDPMGSDQLARDIGLTRYQKRKIRTSAIDMEVRAPAIVALD